MKKNLFLAAVALLALAACSSNEENAPAAPSQLQVTAGLGSETRAEGGTWTASAVIAITAVKGDDSYVGQTWTNKSGEGKTAAFKAYDNKGYTFAENSTVKFAAVTYNTTISPSVTNDKTVVLSATNGTLPDLYVSEEAAEASSDKPSIKFNFKHVFADLVIVISKETEITKEIKEATISNFISSATVTLGEEISKTSGSADGTAKFTPIANTGNEFVVYPSEQTINLAIKAGDGNDANTYYAKLNQTFEANKKYTYNFKLTRTGLSIIGGTEGDDGTVTAGKDASTIEDWDTGTVTGAGSTTDNPINATMVDK